MTAYRTVWACRSDRVADDWGVVGAVRGGLFASIDHLRATAPWSTEQWPGRADRLLPSFVRSTVSVARRQGWDKPKRQSGSI